MTKIVSFAVALFVSKLTVPFLMKIAENYYLYVKQAVKGFLGGQDKVGTACVLSISNRFIQGGDLNELDS